MYLKCFQEKVGEFGKRYPGTIKYEIRLCDSLHLAKTYKIS